MHLFCYWLWNISLTSMSGVLSSVSSRHHSVLSGVRCTAGLVSFRLQVSWGTTVHSCLGSRLGTSLVTRWHVFWGFRSQDSSGTSTRESICQHEADSIIIVTHVTVPPACRGTPPRPPWPRSRGRRSPRAASHTPCLPRTCPPGCLDSHGTESFMFHFKLVAENGWKLKVSIHINRVFPSILQI